MRGRFEPNLARVELLMHLMHSGTPYLYTINLGMTFDSVCHSELSKSNTKA